MKLQNKIIKYLIGLLILISTLYLINRFFYNAVHTYPLGSSTKTIDKAKDIGVFIDDYLAIPNYIIVPNTNDTSKIISIWIQNKFNFQKSLFNKTKIEKTDMFFLRIEFLLEEFPELIIEDRISGKKKSIADYKTRCYWFNFEYIPDSLDINIYTKADNEFIQNIKLVRKSYLKDE